MPTSWTFVPLLQVSSKADRYTANNYGWNRGRFMLRPLSRTRGIAVKAKTGKGKRMGNRIVETRRFGARAGNEKAAQQFLSDVLKLSSMPLKACNDVRLAVEELFNNISSYAYGQDSGILDLTVSVDDTACTVSVLISDEGRAFDPFAEDRHNTTGDPSLAGTPGLGILLVRRLMDGCSYQRVRGRNETTIIKHWTTPRKNAEALADAARVIRVMEGSEYNAPERSQRPLTDDDLTLVVGGLTMPDLPFLRPLGRSVRA